ncbi:baculoviral IAP repeat-containing protein 7-A [Biomphalaria pfeifferi]|uniref:Baculoviral IAP repeat-containing protein 7-A n=1 Tax=Biomphalaria pfeifferi TaxID=112525 RepID=A0AAD8EZ26_BIOPF|nr:baculoviral IAP repeat-containing protein 7-A [Biomphalaria pfeifferi]
MNPAFSNGDQIYATTLAERGFIYIEHAGENLIYCPFCFNFFYNDLVTNENVCTHAPNCPYTARAWNQHGNNNIGAMNITVDIEYREIYRNVHNLFNLPFVNRGRTRQDNVNASVRSISIRNLNEFQDIHSRENQIANQLSVAENIDSSNLVHQETETNVIALSDFNRSPQELNTTNDHIPFKMEMEKIGDAASSFQLDSKDNPLKRDPADKTIAFVIDKAEAIKDDEKLRTLRQQIVCKICKDKEVAVVFLPCGHFVSCTVCAAAIKECPVCRNRVMGLVRAFMS